MAVAVAMPASLDLSHSALLSWALTGQTDINDELRDEDVDFSDDDSDCSNYLSPANSPTAMKTKDAGTPSSVSDVASVTAPWPARPERRKRKRMSDEERKVRHREVQRQFMKRKRARIAELRKVQSGVKKQLRLVTVLQEIEQLKKENEALQKQYEEAESADAAKIAEMPLPKTFGDLVFTIPAQDDQDEDKDVVMEIAHDDILITETEWNEIFDVLSDDGNAEFDGDSDASSQC